MVVVTVFGGWIVRGGCFEIHNYLHKLLVFGRRVLSVDNVTTIHFINKYFQHIYYSDKMASTTWHTFYSSLFSDSSY